VLVDSDAVSSVARSGVRLEPATGILSDPGFQDLRGSPYDQSGQRCEVGKVL